MNYSNTKAEILDSLQGEITDHIAYILQRCIEELQSNTLGRLMLKSVNVDGEDSITTMWDSPYLKFNDDWRVTRKSDGELRLDDILEAAIKEHEFSAAKAAYLVIEDLFGTISTLDDAFLDGRYSELTLTEALKL